MSGSKKWAAALIALGLGATFTAKAAEPVPGPQPTTQELMAQIEALKAKVNQMEQTQSKYDSRDVDATVAAVLKDANRHSMLIDGTGVTAGWDSTKYGFFVGSEDGSSYFHPGIVWWYRGVANYRQSIKNNGRNDTQNGFENSLLKPYIDGTLFNKDFAYRFQWTFDRTNGTLLLDDAYVAYVFSHNAVMGGDLAIKAGQYKPQLFHEQYLGDPFQLGIDRSYANALIGGGDLGPRVQGLSLLLTGANSPLHAELLLDDGERSANTDFQDNRPAAVPPDTAFWP